ncbi:hypothetical protein HMPREF0372_03898 [Flavonifractor plautii ATCC 29863]|uniref:Uncharacterized protein n=2 Tax=Flavonifractor plautii TaxID=292800 RepID=G9YWI2_FLAPL|nr:hypothetical protein HMPREF0372_03898 [Flavonifractor plautii ATCC 29863]
MRHHLREVPGHQGGRRDRGLFDGADRGVTLPPAEFPPCGKAVAAYTKNLPQANFLHVAVEQIGV